MIMDSKPWMETIFQNLGFGTFFDNGFLFFIFMSTECFGSGTQGKGLYKWPRPCFKN